MDIKIVKSRRKTLAVEVSRTGEVTVRAPMFCTKRRIEAFIAEKRGWIEKTVLKMQNTLKLSRPLSEAEIAELRKKAKETIPKRVAYWADIMCLNYGSVKITSAKGRFGSCSAKNNLCFSLYLMQFEDSLIDYVVVHELAHTVHHNHSKEFYKLIEKYMPDHKTRQKALKGRGCPIYHKNLTEEEKCEQAEF